jgi:hypothetical protein
MLDSNQPISVRSAESSVLRMEHKLERTTGFEPVSPRWERRARPLRHVRSWSCVLFSCQRTDGPVGTRTRLARAPAQRRPIENGKDGRSRTGWTPLWRRHRDHSLALIRSWVDLRVSIPPAPVHSRLPVRSAKVHASTNAGRILVSTGLARLRRHTRRQLGALRESRPRNLPDTNRLLCPLS